ncbi:sentrin-specific protease 7 isoform X2 [Ctenopharyngodon idella]|uniref:sentrin-specific protease 7 isoform X2 n=1 Tax=Ctenopharyngodon idella TaxID=7959 RepID=UPI0022325DBF|nr:sentrin-specific protease 7 isoform X2 [Ctenopharyngodon idella]
MPHEESRNSLSDSCNFTLDRRRALTLSPGIKRDNCQIHWTQLASNGTSSQSDPKSQKNSIKKYPVWQEIQRRQVRVVLEDVLQTEIGQRLKCSGQSCKKTDPSESKRRSVPTSTAALKDERRTSLTTRGGTDSTEPKDTSPSHNQTESYTENESCPHKEIKNLLSKQMNSSLKLSESSEVSSNSCSARESDLPQAVQISEQLPKQTKPSTFEENEASLFEGSSQDEEALSSGFEIACSPSSPLATQGCLREKKSASEHLPNKKERRETQESPKDSAGDKENHLCRNGEVVQEVEGMRGSVLRLSVGADGQIPVKRCRMDGFSAEQVPNSDLTSGSTEGRSFIIESSKLNLSETIVLSSEEEEEREEEESSALNIQPPECAKVMNKVDKSARVYEQENTPECHSDIMEMDAQSSAVMELQLSSLHMGGVNVTSGESMEISTDKITFSLKDSSVKISILTASVRKYSLWEVPTLRGCGLVKDNEVPPPSLLLLWLSDAQAQKLRDDLSVIESGTRPAEGSTCVLLCLAEPVSGVESAVLASLMDLVGLKQSSSDLLCPLTQPDSLKLLQSSQETHLLQLLTPKIEAQTSTAAHAAVSAVKSQDSDVHLKPVYTLCHKRAQGSYSVSLASTLGAEWTPYRHCVPARRLILFPPPPSKGAITVTTEDLECLDSGEFLNDVIIDFYLKYLMVRKAPQASVNRSHVFSSFFYKQLTRRDNANEDSTSTPAQVRRHQRVRTWTRHVDIFDKDFLFVPVNQEAHWYLVVICFPGLEEPQYVKRDGRGSVQSDGSEGLGESEGEMQGENRSNSDDDKNTDDSHIKSSTSHTLNCTENTCKRHTVCKRPCILIMDSLKLSVHERIFKLLREYLQVEWEVKRGGYRDFSVDHMVGSHCKVPLQDNSSDCGLYLLQYAESFLQDPVLHFDLPLRLERWFPRQQVRGKREEIRDLILNLYRFQKGSLGNEALEDGTDHGNVTQ